MTDHRSDEHKHPDGNEIPDSIIRVEYNFPPLRAIFSMWLAALPEADEKDIRDYIARKQPGVVIRKIERITKGEAKLLSGGDNL